MDPVRLILTLSIIWAVSALAVQVYRAWGGGRRDFSRRTGSGVRGLAYNFTIAMLPAHKESVRHHPAKFAIGLIMHLGVLLALVDVLLLLVLPDAGLTLLAMARLAFAVSFAAGIYLLVRRAISRDLRAMSVPDDYISNALTCGLLGIAAATPTVAESQTVLLIYATVLLLYLPLGKLRHAVFFFVARADLGRRLGYRGVYPPQTARVN